MRVINAGGRDKLVLNVDQDHFQELDGWPFALYFSRA